MTATTAPRRHWRSDGTEPLPSGRDDLVAAAFERQGELAEFAASRLGHWMNFSPSMSYFTPLKRFPTYFTKLRLSTPRNKS